MYVIVGILVGVIITLICILGSYMRQVKDICRQLRFLREHESNMLITKEIKLGNIKELTDLLNEMIKERKEEAAQYVKKERQNLTQILKETVFSYYDEWAERGIVPEFDLTDTPVWIMGNGQALRRIIQNIVKNGLDHGNKELKIQLKKKENRAKLVFKNRVEYPDRIDLQRVFERFYKADEARSKNSTGLGLSITKGFVLKMNGEISAQMKGDWFSIHISFPLI